MSYGTTTLEGYYIKCGVPDQEAKVISSLYGEDYIHSQADMRRQGNGNKSKALAAVLISDQIFNGPSLFSDFPIWNNIESLNDVQSVVNIVKAAGVCSVCVYAYALDMDISEQAKQTFNDFLWKANRKAVKMGGSLDTQKLLDDFCSHVTRLSISSEAHGKRKGLLTKLFG